MLLKIFHLSRQLIVSTLICLIPSFACSQEYKPYLQLEQHNIYIDYLINSGRLVIPHPLNQPYKVNELLDSLPAAASTYTSHWSELLRKDLLLLTYRHDSLSQVGSLLIGAHAGDRMNNTENDFDNSLFGDAFLTYSFKNLGIYYRFDLDEAFRDDKNYFGGTGKFEKPISSRTGIAYLQWDSRFITLFIGRMSQNYGIINEPGLLLSSNPFSYDQIGIQITNRLLKFSSFITRLEDIYGYDIRDSVATPYWNKRYMSVHRLEFSFSQKLNIAISESVIFGGKSQTFVFPYLNPVNIFYISKLSDRKNFEEGDANVLASLELFYKPSKSISFFTQFLLDDMDFTKELRRQFPDRIGFSSKLVYSDPFLGSQVYVRYSRISNWTYNSFYNWGNYTFYGKSLGYPKNGDENFSIGLDVLRFSPFILRLLVKREREREQDLKSPFIAEKTSFPIGIPQKSSSLRVESIWFPRTWLNASMEVESIRYNNYRHISNKTEYFLNIYFSIRFIGFFKLMNSKSKVVN